MKVHRFKLGQRSKGLTVMGVHAGRVATVSRTAFVMWLLVASFLVALVAPGSPAASGALTSGQLASLVIGQTDFTSHAPGLGPSSFYNPFRPTFDSSGNLWVADENNHRVLEFKPPFSSGEPASVVIGQTDFSSNVSAATRSTLSGPVAVAFDHSGDLWVADFVNNRTLEFSPPFANGMNASLELGQPAGPNQFTSSGTSSGPGALHSPVALAFDHAGSLWVVDRLNNRVLEFNPPFVDGESASRVIGQPDFTSNAALLTDTGLNGPESVAFDSSGNLWVVDQRSNRVLEYPASSLGSNGPAAALEIGQAAGQDQFGTGVSGTSQSELNAPVGIAFDPSGDLLLADRANNRVLGFAPPFTDGMNASFEIGQPPGPAQFTSAGFGASQGSLHNPLGLAFDAHGNLWVADQLNCRVLEFSGTANETSTSSTTSISSSVSTPGTSSASAPSFGTSEAVAGALVLVLGTMVVVAFAFFRRRRK